MKNLVLLLFLSVPVFGFSQWSKTLLQTQQRVNEGHTDTASKELYTLDANKLVTTLKGAPTRNAGQKGIIMTLPNMQGKMEKFEVWELSNMAPDLQAKYTDIKSYVGSSKDDSTAYLRFSVSPQGFSSLVLRAGISEYIEPYTTDAKTYVVFDSTMKKKSATDQPFECEVKENAEHGSQGTITNNKLVGSNTFRLALSCTGEYSQYILTRAGTPVGATDAEKIAVVLGAMNASMTRLNGVYEKDLSLHYNLISETEALIFLNAATDPYAAGGGPDVANTGINSALGPNARTLYDLGHLIDKKPANGAAYLGVICGSASVQKAGGWTAHNIPVGATFDIDYVAHEMGHQMGAGHSYTFSTTQQSQKVEPGSGSTIMAYTGIVGNLDVQYNSHDNFHYSSISQIKSKINSVACGTNVPYTLLPPNLDAGPNYVIPHTTPYVVRATTTDTNNASYTYTFEQIDQADAAQMGALSYTYLTKPSGPNFRALPQTTQPYRYFPNFNTVLAGVNTTRWESLNSNARDLNFGVVLRNSNPLEPNIAQDAMKVTVNASAGPFKVTAPIFGQSLSSGNTFTITWDVANTTLPPVSTANVNIKLSKDGGLTFTTLLANTANDGSESVTLPTGSSASNAYIIIEAVNNIYYAVSPSFVIDYAVSGESCATYTYSGPAVTITDSPGGGGISSPKIEIPLNIPDSGVITKLTVSPNITHGNLTQLSFGIESPVGSSALLMHHQCSSSGINATFTDEAGTLTCGNPVSGNSKPFETLTIFKGHDSQGTWKLFASDNSPNVVGTVNSWSLNVCTRDESFLGTTENKNLFEDIKIYPNPSNGNFFVKTKKLTGKVETSIFDLSGKKVYSSVNNQSTEQTTKEYNLNLPKGVYIVSVKSDKGAYTQKLIIK
ncbi:zinc-dependent metalloprotease [Kaistella antarctica]|uniref:Por secretion system C-terminal sorting domain n=1 Tax=Kaistella antarctica TaxID=266748 RepID=A0A448NR65_9FLAO|nr:zinc-dependent metalloprotease family protein [Kaistella antarctica]SEW14258.1 Por secretion system C-terminal sorting domain-containing protein [Kaistella antarctica]VEH99287.1 Por secretion system C-terminal sorting domain [Kaistella antarctica]